MLKGDSSTHAFLGRVCGQLSHLGRALPREATREMEHTDKSPPRSMLILPDKSQALEYLDCFFDHLNATYRYLSRAKMQGLLERVYNDDAEVLQCDATMALFLSIIGNGYGSILK